MKLLLSSCCILALGAGAVAQTTFKSSPNGYLTTEGEDRAYIMFEYSNPRILFFDGEMRNSVMVMKEVAFRYDYRNYSTGVGMGRSWTNVTLDMATCDYSKPSFIFSQNATSTPARVFSASLTLPTQTGYPSSQPAAFSMPFPFSSSWLYNGGSDICLDFDFTGGTMANNAAWATGWYHSYYLDAPSAGTVIQGGFNQIGTGCVDSGQTNNSLCWITSYVYNSKYTSNTAWRDQYRVFTRSRYTPDKAPVIHALGPFGNTTGISFPGTTCEKIYVDVTNYFIQLGLVGGGSTTVYSQDFLFPHNAAFEGVKLYAQAAFEDSVTKKFSLTYAEDTTLPAYPQSFKRGCLWQTDTTLKGSTAIQTGLSGPVEDATHNPVIRYGQ